MGCVGVGCVGVCVCVGCVCVCVFGGWGGWGWWGVGGGWVVVVVVVVVGGGINFASEVRRHLPIPFITSVPVTRVSSNRFCIVDEYDIWFCFPSTTAKRKVRDRTHCILMPRRIEGIVNFDIGMSDFHNITCASTKLFVPKTFGSSFHYRSYKKNWRLSIQKRFNVCTFPGGGNIWWYPWLV